jgi:hypothetical protein
MHMSRKSRLFRRIAVAVASLQLVTFAGASVLEAAAVANQKVVWNAVHSAQSHGGAIHDPWTCPACQLLTAPARRSEAVAIALPTVDARATTQRNDVARPENAARTGFSSRAPPSP